jgi:RHS repeat-associated protein
LGTERTVTNSSQTVTGTINYDGFGQRVGTTGSSTSPYMFAATSGYRTEGDAGLQYVGARFYDPQVGRFITRDTEIDEHAYLYCDHDPVNGVDPSGHLAKRGGGGATGDDEQGDGGGPGPKNPPSPGGSISNYPFGKIHVGPGPWIDYITGGASIGLNPFTGQFRGGWHHLFQIGPIEAGGGFNFTYPPWNWNPDWFVGIRHRWNF